MESGTIVENYLVENLDKRCAFDGGKEETKEVGVNWWEQRVMNFVESKQMNAKQRAKTQLERDDEWNVVENFSTVEDKDTVK